MKGSALVEVLITTVVMSVGLAGLARLLAATARQEGQAGRRMRARLLALDALEQGAPEVHGTVAVTLDGGPGLRTAKAIWQEADQTRTLRLTAWRGHE